MSRITGFLILLGLLLTLPGCRRGPMMTPAHHLLEDSLAEIEATTDRPVPGAVEALIYTSSDERFQLVQRPPWTPDDKASAEPQPPAP